MKLVFACVTAIVLVTDVTSNWEPLCDIDGLGECDYAGHDMCSNMGCVLVKLEGCDERTRDRVTGSEYEELYNTWMRECLAIRTCDVEGARRCGATSPGASTEQMCRSMDCTIRKVEGCDQETLDSLTGATGTTIQDMQETMHRMCFQDTSCNIASVENCNSPGQDQDTICRNTQCILDSLQGCDTKKLNEILEQFGGQTVESLQDLREAMECA